jgi:hypothetical protein
MTPFWTEGKAKEGEKDEEVKTDHSMKGPVPIIRFPVVETSQIANTKVRMKEGEGEVEKKKSIE